MIGARAEPLASTIKESIFAPMSKNPMPFAAAGAVDNPYIDSYADNQKNEPIHLSQILKSQLSSLTEIDFYCQFDTVSILSEHTVNIISQA